MASVEAAAAPAQACIDRGAAEQFLSLLGKDPASARLRALAHAQHALADLAEHAAKLALARTGDDDVRKAEGVCLQL